jgi:hypothetical protein
MFNSPYICFGRDSAIIRGTNVQMPFAGRAPTGHTHTHTHRGITGFCALNIPRLSFFTAESGFNELNELKLSLNNTA